MVLDGGPKAPPAPAPQGAQAAPQAGGGFRVGELPGTTQGRAIAGSEEDALTASMPPLSPEAQNARDLMVVGGALNNRALESAGQGLLNADPTHEFRKKQAEGMGQSAAQRADAKRAGHYVLKSLAQIYGTMNDPANQEKLPNALGPFNNTPLDDAYTFDPTTWWRHKGMTPPQAAAASRWYNVPARMIGDSSAWDLQNRLQHQTEALVTDFMGSAGKGLNMSDSRQKAFSDAVGKFMQSTNRPEAVKVLDDAKMMIANMFGMTPEEAQFAIDVAHNQDKRARLLGIQNAGAAQLQMILDNHENYSNEELQAAMARARALKGAPAGAH
jgi:hypothetical protein